MNKDLEIIREQVVLNSVLLSAILINQHSTDELIGLPNVDKKRIIKLLKEQTEFIKSLSTQPAPHTKTESSTTNSEARKGL